ncbi:BNR-4 repeat-containing protein [Flavivirga amylovorans]|uniref:BNR-4 repeat-containing protein n=1 Tax=Flavivirga amylovorans TaxID=870486 RepID=A0ABT8WZH4_9FLAO|nr:BNR-4 repeat-containing protein [Flavivirga amylovorans]MDO5987078.1 BNR-4 repeat-containing protein [Flavivirga amylovorans]
MNLQKLTLITLLFFSLNCFAQKPERSFSSDLYKTFTSNGAWCWFADPRAVSLNNKIYSGWVTSNGSIMVGSYNQDTSEIKEVNLFPEFNKDDHANPSFLILPNKKIMIFFSSHNGMGKDEKAPSILYAVTKKPEDISEWEPLQRKTENVEGPKGFCYTNPVLLSEENNRIYLFWRGADWKPTFSYSDDFGKTWSKSTSLIKSSLNGLKRPYVKVSSNNKDEIYFAFTDGHPRNEPLNSIYYLKYKAGKFYKADGSVVGTLDALPIEHESCDVVYNANDYFLEHRNGVPAWIWDVSCDKKGNPVVVYTRLPEETKHEYYYAIWDKTSWKNSKIAAAGSSFPRYNRTKEMRDPEPHYSGGIYLDHNNTNIVYYSKPVHDIFEIFTAETKDLGANWEETALTSDSMKDNVRPFVLKDTNEDSKIQVLWMYNDRYSEYKDYNTRIKMDVLRIKVKEE